MAHAAAEQAEKGSVGLPAAPTWEEVQIALLAGEASPVVVRYRALFHAKQVAPSPADAGELLERSLRLQSDSVLLRHEVAYVLGQLGRPSAVPLMRAVLMDEAEDEIVRHEAAEALAALSQRSQSPDFDSRMMASELEALAAQTASISLRHTCELAAAGLLMGDADDSGASKIPVCVCQYTSKDPAPGLVNATDVDVPAAAAILADVTLPLYERYKGMFTLRNVGGEMAVKALAGMLLADTTSAVLRHEVAFVLGQMEDEAAAEALAQALARPEEHGMVRHEAAIALGAIGTPIAEMSLREHLHDSDKLVAESCEVALATAAYWRAWEELEARIKGPQASLDS
ncbi:unnamed protein product [Polarella glacialis]|uniref:Deoxyhypusine hydroxylase n=1 Tax=Polarella glacialis TaxID=89957 RepID=A0A813LRG9_POLGL|nr:unnamed protein product [Polarella glacialis]